MYRMPHSFVDLSETIRSTDGHHRYGSLTPLYTFVYGRHFDDK